MKLAIIPARGGSKRIVHKNIKPFCGKPILAYSIETALRSGCFDDIIVSTDDEEIACVAHAYGANVPFQRPEYLSDDHATTSEVVAHAIIHSGYATDAIEAVCCIYATAPLLQASFIQEGYENLVKNHATYSFSATRFAAPIQRALSLDEHNKVQMLLPENFLKRSQDLQEIYHDAGQFYWGRTEAWLGQQPLFEMHSSAIVLPSYLVKDIDTLEDWQHAEYLYKAIYAS